MARRLNLPLFNGQALSTDEYRALMQSKQSESEVQASIVRELQTRGWMVLRVNGGGTDQYGGWRWNYTIYGFRKVNSDDPNGHDALTDLLAFKGDGGPSCQAVFIEVKRHRGKMSPRQQEFVAFCKLFGIEVHEFQTWQQAADLIKSL